MKRFYLFFVSALISTGLLAFLSHQFGKNIDSKFLNLVFNLAFLLAMVAFVFHLKNMFDKAKETDKGDEEEKKKEKEEVIPKEFRQPGGIKTSNGMVIFFLLLPFLASAQGTNTGSTINTVVTILVYATLCFIAVAVPGVAYFSDPKYSSLWKEWSPWHRATWRPFLVNLWLYRFLEPLFFARTWRVFFKNIGTASRGIGIYYCQIVGSISIASFAMFLLNEKSYSGKFKR